MADVRIGGVYATFRADNNPWLRASKQNIAAIKRQGRATRELQRDARRLRATMRSLVGSLGLFAGGAGIAGISRGAYSAARSLSTLGSTLVENSQRLSLTAEQIQLLGRVFEGGGASQQEFIKGFRTFARTLVDAQSGLETYRRSFRLVGINVDELAANNVTLYDAFLRLADGLKSVEDQAVRVNVAQTLLGRSGTQLLYVLQGGRDDILASAEAFRALGLISDEQAARLKALEQSYVDTSNAVRVAQAKIVADNGNLFHAFNQFVAQAIPQAFQALVSTLNTLRENLGIVTKTLQLFFAVLISRSAFGRFLTSLGKAVIALGSLKVAALGTNVAIRALGRVGVVGLIVEGIFVAIDAFRALQKEAKRTGDSIVDIFGSVGRRVAAILVSALARGLFKIQEFILRTPEILVADVLDAIDGEGVKRTAEIFREINTQAREVGLGVVHQLGLASDESAAQTERVWTDAARRVRDRYTQLFSDAPTITLPELPPPRDVPYRAGDTAAERDALELRRRANTLLADQESISVRIVEATRERAEAAAREVDFLRRGLSETSAQRVVEEGLAAFRQEQVRLLTELESSRTRQVALSENLRQAEAAGLLTISSELAKQLEAEKKITRETLSQLALEESKRAAFEAELEAQAAVIERQAEARAELERYQQLWRGLAQSVEDFATRAILNFESIGDAARNLGRIILESLTRALVIRPLLGGLFGAGGLGLPGFASGGVGNGLALVGERGPEIVDFRNPGRVYTNAELAAAFGGSGGGPNTFNFAPVIQSADSAAVRQAVAEAFPPFRAAIIGDLRQDLRRPSGVRSDVRRA